MFSVKWAIFVDLSVQFQLRAELGVLDHKVFDAVVLIVVLVGW